MACQVVPRAGPVVAGERGKQGVGLVFEQGQLDARVGAAEGAEQAAEAPVGQGVDRADGAAAGERAGERRDRLAPAIGRLKRRPCVRQQGLAGRVSMAPRRSRTNRCSPSSASRRRICWLMAGFAIGIRSAARVKLCSSATVTK